MAASEAEVAEEVLSALDWAQVRTMAADGLSQREIACRLGATAGLWRLRLRGSVDLVRSRLPELRPRKVRPAQRTAYRPAG